jgi:type II secretory pathway pseudopilin PulG
MSFDIKKTKYTKRTDGYTLIELVVSVGLFVVVSLISSSAFLGVTVSNRRTLAIRTTTDNLNSAIESMSRNLKTGFFYHCGSSGSIAAPQDCPSGDTYLAFEGQKGDILTTSDQIIYKIGPAGTLCSSSKQICVSTDGGGTFYPLTAPPPEVSIDGLAFRVYGSTQSDSPAKQPRIVIVIIGSAGIGISATSFNVETTISQRLPDQT